MLLSRVRHALFPTPSNPAILHFMKKLRVNTSAHCTGKSASLFHSRSRHSVCRHSELLLSQRQRTVSPLMCGVVPPPSLIQRTQQLELRGQIRGVYSREEKDKKKEKFHYWDGKNKEGSGNPEENMNGELRNWLWYKFRGLVDSNDDLKKSYDEVTQKIVDPLKEKMKKSEEKAKDKFGFVTKPFEKVEETIRDTVEGKLSKEAKEKAAEEEKQKRHKEMEWDDDEPAETNQKKDEEPESENEFIREAKKKNEENSQPKKEFAGFFSKQLDGFRGELNEAFRELFGHQPKSTMRTQLKVQRPSKETDEANAKATAEAEDDKGEKVNVEDTPGKGALVVVKGQQTTWEKLSERLREAPLIQNILKTGKVIGRSPVGKAAGKVRDTIHDRVEDVHEFWETSQNPLVYKLSAAWDLITSETEEAIALREFRRLDPKFDPYEWKTDVVENFMPEFLEAFLRGNTRQLKEWCGEGVYGKLKQEIRKRKADGLVLDHQVFAIENDEILAIKADGDGTGQPPAVVVQLMAQQVNCIRNREGEIVEGAEDQIRANYYVIAFQREYKEDSGELVWSVADMMMVGAFPYL